MAAAMLRIFSMAAIAGVALGEGGHDRCSSEAAASEPDAMPSVVSLVQLGARKRRDSGERLPGGLHRVPPMDQPGEVPICIEGKGVPRLYMLGYPKSATTSAAEDFLNAGIAYKEKELHTFELVCNQTKETGLSEEVVMGIVQRPSCPEYSEHIKEFWLSNVSFAECGKPIGTFMDATPGNVVLPGLSSLLADIYGTSGQDLAFVLFLREPVERMQSSWYMFQENVDDFYSAILGSSFSEWLNKIVPALLQFQARDFEGVIQNHTLHIPYTSLYSRNLEPWLQQFRPGQFSIVPMGYYLESAVTRDAVIDNLSQQFKLTMHSGGDSTDVTKENTGIHPPLEDDISPEMLKQLREEVFQPDLLRLAGMLAPRLEDGLTIQGYEGAANAQEIYEYLLQNM